MKRLLLFTTLFSLVMLFASPPDYGQEKKETKKELTVKKDRTQELLDVLSKADLSNIEDPDPLMLSFKHEPERVNPKVMEELCGQADLTLLSLARWEQAKSLQKQKEAEFHYRIINFKLKIDPGLLNKEELKQSKEFHTFTVRI